MTAHEKAPMSKRAAFRLAQEAAERVRVARTMCAAFPSEQRQQELAAAIAEFNELNAARRDEAAP